MNVPTAEVGLVILFSFLWKSEHERGLTEGQKARPCLIIMVGKQVVVCPFTHTRPGPGVYGVRIPDEVKIQLGLDAEPQWIIASEVNFTDWPGSDVRETHKQSCEIGFAPPALLDKVIKKIQAASAAGKLKNTQRNPAAHGAAP